MSDYCKLNIGGRHTLRGLKRCPGCGKFNGNRSQLCRNTECPLRQQVLIARKSLDPVQLVSYNDIKLYSVQVKEKFTAPRNFVQITDTHLIPDAYNSMVSRSAICFIETCKYHCNGIEVGCKHVKNALESSKPAEELRIQHDVIWNLRIDVEQRVRLWQMYKEDEEIVPAVQRINKTVFVTKCLKTHLFPVGRIHVSVFTNDSSIKSGLCSCACKKLKILLSPNSSVHVKEDVCDHLLLVLAAVLSKHSLHDEFSDFTNELKAFWAKQDVQNEPDPSGTATGGDIFIFDNELLQTDDLSEFSDNILKPVLHDENANSSNQQSMYQGDPSMISGCTVDDVDIPFVGIGCGADGISDESTRLELSDCNIELMDQFQLTDHIDLCNDEVILSNSDLFQGNSIIMPDLADTISDDLNQNLSQLLPVTPVQLTDPTLTTEIPPKKPKKAIVEQTPGLLVATPNPVNTLKPIDPGPSLDYVMWLDHVIECINMSIDFNSKEPNVELSFNVHEDIFTHFSKSFTCGPKYRLPNSTVLIKKGKLKGLLKYTWILRTASKVQKIFTTKNMSIEVEKRFQPSGDTYVPYVDEHTDLIVLNKKYKQISPKMCVAHIWFDCNNSSQRTGFKLDWIPNVFPRSGFGIFNIEFSIGLRK